MLLDPLKQLVKVAALVHRVEVRVGAVVSEHPVGRDRCDVSCAHEDLAEEVDAVVYLVSLLRAVPRNESKGPSPIWLKKSWSPTSNSIGMFSGRE